MDKSRFSAHVSLKDIKINDSFWGPIMERIRTEVIPYQWEALNDRVPGAEPSYCMRNFRIAAQMTHPGLDYGVDSSLGFDGRVFQDSDFAKWVEAAAYSLEWHPDPALEKIADEAIDIVCNAQQGDGYLNTYYIINGLEKRFTNFRDNHELYCLGHLLEGGIAYFQATGKRKLLDALVKYVDCVDKLIGTEPGKMRAYPGHEILEMALVRLYEISKDEKHLKLARYIVDERGREPLYFDQEAKKTNTPMRWEKSYMKFQYYQAGKPVREQKAAQGHAVRAVYLYAGMADVARAADDDTLMDSCNALWDNIVNRQMYITGAIGQTSQGEAFTFDYDLPNDLVYGETCASIGLAFFARRMTSIAPRAGYADVLEKTLYNGTISGMSLDGKKFFYVNPLEVHPEKFLKYDIMHRHDVERQSWFSCACCPPNLARFVASLGSYVYSARPDALYTHLFIGNQLKIKLGGTDVELNMENRYPWEEDVDVSFRMNGNAVFTYAVRLPAWCAGYSIKLNGQDAGFTVEDGYALIRREWHNGDSLNIVFDMPVTLVQANPKVRDNAGKAAVMRGPIVYCLEEADNGNDLHRVYLEGSPQFSFRFEPRLLEGVVTLSCRGKRLKGWDNDDLYRPASPARFEDTDLTWIPYYTWTNRSPGEMLVWVRTK